MTDGDRMNSLHCRMCTSASWQRGKRSGQRLLRPHGEEAAALVGYGGGQLRGLGAVPLPADPTTGLWAHSEHLTLGPPGLAFWGTLRLGSVRVPLAALPAEQVRGGHLGFINDAQGAPRAPTARTQLCKRVAAPIERHPACDGAFDWLRPPVLRHRRGHPRHAPVPGSQPSLYDIVESNELKWFEARIC